MTLDRIISLLSLLGLLYFAYGTWRIDRSLSEVKGHLSAIRSLMERWSEHPDDLP